MTSWLRRIHIYMGALTACSVLLGCSPPSAANAQVTVSGNRFERDGAPWVPNGFTLVGRVAPSSHLAGWLQRARTLQGPALLQRARSLGANTLRFQVSQPGLDPQSSIYDAGYIQEVIQAVREARAAGFVVIISMQWGTPSGLEGQPDMPSEATQRAWSQLAPVFADDGGVMLELFNEPSELETNPQAWPIWRAGMQALVDEIRAAGAHNVLILDGIHNAHLLAGAPAIHDPINQLAYAVHPYISPISKGPDDWSRQWGDYAAHHPVLITEWNVMSTLKCRPDDPEIAEQLVEYIRQRHIGLNLWALDLPATLFDAQGQPEGFEGFQCGVAGTGAARLAVQYFKGG